MTFFAVRQSRPLGYLLLGKPQPLIQTFQNGAMGELHLPAPLQTVHSPDRIRVDTKLDEARRQVQQEREEDRKRRDSEQKKEKVA